MPEDVVTIGDWSYDWCSSDLRPEQPRRVAQPQGRHLLPVPARRAIHGSTVQPLPHTNRLLQPGPVQPVPSPQPRAHRILQGLPGLGRLPPPQLDLLVVSLVAEPLPESNLRLLLPHQPERKHAGYGNSVTVRLN